MPIMARDSGGVDYRLVPEALHVAVCDMIVDLGIQKVTWNNTIKEKHQVYIRWQIPGERIEYTKTDDNGDEQELEGPMVIGRVYTLSLHENANLRHDLEKWRGREFTDQELEGFDVTNVLSKPCQVLVEHTTKNGKTYANVSKVLKIPKGTKVPEVEGDAIVYDSSTPGNFEKLPEWLQKKIMGEKPASQQEEPPPPSDDDDIPF